MNFAWIILVTLGSVVGGTSLCFWLLRQAQEVDSTVWILEHVICPIIRILVLLIVVSQVYPVIGEAGGSLQFWRVLSEQGQFNHLINILFFTGLALAFLPLVSHPVIALPLQSMLTVAVVFNWQYRELGDTLVLFPSWATLLKITAYMFLAYFATREASIHLSRRIDLWLHVSGSIRLVSDSIYLLLQIPVILLYGTFLNSQLG